MLKKSIATALLLNSFLFAADASFAQNAATQKTPPVLDGERAPSIEQEIAMMRSDLRSTRTKVIAANMKLTPDEAEKFWPVYDQYVNELVKINNAKYALVKEYLQGTNMTDAQADGLSKRWIEVDESVAQLRLKYIPIFRKTLTAKGTAMFFQLDRRVQMMIDLQVASSIPLIQP